MEATEMQEFSKQMKEGGEESLTRISLAISILAVLVAMVTVLGHRTHTEAVLEQTRAADQWNLYQSKKIRLDATQRDIDMLRVQPNADSKAAEGLIAGYQAHISKWNLDLSEEQAKAQELEHAVDRAEREAARFDLGEALLQIAVVLSSITLFTRTKTYYFGGLALGIAGVGIAVTAFLVR